MIKKINWAYAVGEILIVIIGISIAFMLNNYASNKKEAQARSKYVTSLISDLQDEIQHLEENKLNFQYKIKTAQKIFPYLYGKILGRDTAYSNVFELADVVQLDKHDVTFQALINSGDLDLFDDIEFKKALQNHYTGNHEVKMDYRRQESILENHLGPFMINEMDYKAVNGGDYSFMDKTKFHNIIQSLYGAYLFSEKSTDAAVSRAEAFLKQVEAMRH